MPCDDQGIKGPRGKLIVLEIGPEARNLEQVKVGDRVVVRYAQALTLTLVKDGKELRSKVESVGGDRTAEGQRPGAVVGQKVEVTADVLAIRAALDLSSVERQASPSQPVVIVHKPKTGASLIADRTAVLKEYQDVDYAKRYADFVPEGPTDRR